MTAVTGQRYNQTTDTVDIATNLTDKEYYLVNRGVDNTVAIASDATLPCYVLVEGADGSSVVTTGTIAKAGSVALAKTGGSVTAGDKLTSNASGLAITTTTENDVYFGLAMESGASGDIIPVDTAINGTIEG